MFGDSAPGLVALTDDVLCGHVWERPDLSPRDRSLVDVAALAAMGNSGQLTFHLPNAVRNRVTEGELVEAITYLAFHAGWPQVMSDMAVAKLAFQNR